MLRIRRVGAAMPAQDIERARRFYEQKLGLEPSMERTNGGVMYAVGATGFLLFPSMGKASGDHTQMALDVEDVEEAVRELRSRGVEFEEYDYPNLKTQDGLAELPNGSKGAWFKDTEGNLIGVGSMLP